MARWMARLTRRVERALASEQLLEGIVYELRILWVYAAAGEMSPNPRDDAQLGVRYTPHRVFLILWREVEVLLCGHHYGFGLDRGEGIIVVAVEVGGLTYVAILPRPEHTEEVIGV